MAAVFSTEWDNSVKIENVLGKFGNWKFIGFDVGKNNSILRMPLSVEKMNFSLRFI
jgi:hypothetical protein